MSTAAKCEAIIKAIIDKVNTDPNFEQQFAFSGDHGGHSATIYWDGAHTHVGNFWDGPTKKTWEQLVDELYNQMHGGPGLSWA